MTDERPPIGAVRREPPAFRRVTVHRVHDLGPHLRRITCTGPELAGFPVPAPAASVRLLLPNPESSDLVLPTWNGNEFLLPDGSRPLLRTFTPRELRSDPPEMDLEIVLHGDRGASRWAGRAQVGDPAAVSGPGRGYAIDDAARGFLLLGDEAAIPAIAQLLEVLPSDRPATAHIEVARPDARLDLPGVVWYDLPPTAEPGRALLAALEGIVIPDGTRVWAAGEAAAMQRIRRHLADRGIDRAHTVVRGYWKQGRAGD